MNAFLIPFFLVSHMAVENANLEYVIQAGAMVMCGTEGKVNVNMTFSNDMLCRPKSTDTLVCRMTNGSVTGNLEDSEEATTRPFDIFPDPFEVKFNDLGAEELVVKKGMDPTILNVLRAWVRGLTIGVDFTDKTDETGDFPVEKSNVENCKMNARVRYHEAVNENGELEDKPYDLESLPRLNKPDGKGMEIEKRSILADCTMKHLFVFDDIIMSRLKHKDEGELVEKLDVLEHRLIVTPKNFGSITHRFGEMERKDKETNLRYAETTYLKLLNVRTVDDPMPTVEDPETVPVVD